MARPKSQEDDLSDLGAVPVSPEEDDLSDLGAAPVEAQTEDDLSDLGAVEVIGKAISSNFPNATGIIKEGVRRIGESVRGVQENPNLRSLDPATQAGYAILDARTKLFDETGERVTEGVTKLGASPYAAAAAGLSVQVLPDVTDILYGAAVARETSVLNKLLDRNRPLRLGYNAPIEPPVTVIEPGAEVLPLESGGTKLLKGQRPLALPAPAETAQKKFTTGLVPEPTSESFVMRESPDLAKVQEGDLLSGQPKYPEDIGNRSLRGYVGQHRLSSDVPEFSRLQQTITEEELATPLVSDVADESRRRFSGVDSRIRIEQDLQTGRTSFKLKDPPVREKRTLTANEVASQQATKQSKVVQILDVPAEVVDSSPILPGSLEVPVMKETYISGTKAFLRNVWNRGASAAQDVISRMGPSGQELSKRIALVRDIPQAQYAKAMYEWDKFFSGVPRRDIGKLKVALADALEGRKTDASLPPGLLEKTQKILREIGQEAEAAGLTITNQEGEVVPFALRDNYFPRILKEDILEGILSGVYQGTSKGVDKAPNQVWKKLAERLLETKRVRTSSEAFQLISGYKRNLIQRRYGHLERARELDLPPEFYDRDALRVIPEYVRSAYTRIQEVKQFGLKDEVALDLVSRIHESGNDADLARRHFERFVGVEPRDQITLKAAQGLRNLAFGTLIQVPTTLMQLGQGAYIAYQSNMYRTAKAAVNVFTSLGKEEAARAGQYYFKGLQEYMFEGYGGGKGLLGNFAQNIAKLEGFTRLDHFWRKMSAVAGKDYIENSLVKKLLRNPANKFARTELRFVGLDPDTVIRNKGLTVDELTLATKRFADETQLSPDLTRLPHWWTSPEGKLFTQFKSFGYLMAKANMSLIRRAIEGGGIEGVTRLATMSVGLPVTGYAISKLVEGIKGNSEYQITGQEDVDETIKTLGYATGFGPMMDLMLLTLQGQGRTLSYLAPPSVKNVLEVTDAAGRSVREGSVEPLAKTLTKKTPIVGRILYNKIYGE